MSKSIVAGIDIGGSHITAALVDLETRKVLKDTWTRANVNSHAEVEGIITDWSKAIKKACALSKSEIPKIGIGMPGPVDYDKGTCYIKGQDKYESLYGLNIKELLSASLNSDAANIRMINDAACFLQGEVFGGAARGFERAVGLTLGTGLGSSVYNDFIAKDADLWNSPFRESIAEDYLSTRWFLKRYYELTGQKASDVKYLAQLAGNNSKVMLLFEEFGANLGMFLNEFIQAENPEVIVLGGNIAHAFNLFEASLKNSIRITYRHIPLHKAVLGEEAAILGASSLWNMPLSEVAAKDFLSGP